MSGLIRGGLPIYAFSVMLFLLAPILIIVPLAFSSVNYLAFPPPGLSTQWVDAVVSSGGWASSFRYSIEVGITATAVTVLLGLPSSVGLVRARFKGKSLAYLFVVSPLIVPTVITSISVYFFLAPFGLTGSATVTGIAHGVLCLPIFVVIVCASLQGFDEQLERAAVSLGSSPWHAFAAITLPAIAPGVVSGTVLAFLTSFDELIMALLLAGPGAQTLQVQIWSALQYSIDPSVAAVGVLLMAALVVGGLLVALGRGIKMSGVFGRFFRYHHE